RIWRDQHIIPNCDIADQNGVRTDPDLVSYCGYALVFPAVGLCDGNALRDIAVFADFGFWIDDHCAPMPEVKTLANLCFGVNLKTIFDLMTSQNQTPEHA